MASVVSTIAVPEAELYRARLTRVTLVWVLTALVLFPALAILGLLMRTQQGGYLQAMPPEVFYAIMTLHGLGMVGLWFVAGMAVISVLLVSYVKPTTAVSWIAYGATVTGVVLLLAATLIGRLGVGWYIPLSVTVPFGWHVAGMGHGVALRRPRHHGCGLDAVGRQSALRDCAPGPVFHMRSAGTI